MKYLCTRIDSSREMRKCSTICHCEINSREKPGCCLLDSGVLVKWEEEAAPMPQDGPENLPPNNARAEICAEYIADGFPCVWQNGAACSTKPCTPRDREERRKLSPVA
jgi:hypothetical protein